MSGSKVSAGLSALLVLAACAQGPVGSASVDSSFDDWISDGRPLSLVVNSDPSSGLPPQQCYSFGGDDSADRVRAVIRLWTVKPGVFDLVLFDPEPSATCFDHRASSPGDGFWVDVQTALPGVAGTVVPLTFVGYRDRAGALLVYDAICGLAVEFSAPGFRPSVQVFVTDAVTAREIADRGVGGRCSTSVRSARAQRVLSAPAS